MAIRFDNYTLDDYLNIETFQGFGMPQTRDHEISLSNANGSFYDGTHLESRLIAMGVSLTKDDNTTNIYQKLDTLKTIFAPWKGERKLEFDLYPDRYIMARYSGIIDIENLGGMFRFPLQFKCSDPLFYSNTETVVALDGDDVVNNVGSWPSRSTTIQIGINAATTLTIKNNTTSKQLVLTNSTASNAELFIDFKTGSITSVDKQQNYATYYVSGEFFTLQPGANQILLTNASSSFGKTFKFRSTWV